MELDIDTFSFVALEEEFGSTSKLHLEQEGSSSTHAPLQELGAQVYTNSLPKSKGKPVMVYSRAKSNENRAQSSYTQAKRVDRMEVGRPAAYRASQPHKKVYLDA